MHHSRPRCRVPSALAAVMGERQDDKTYLVVVSAMKVPEGQGELAVAKRTLVKKDACLFERHAARFDRRQSEHDVLNLASVLSHIPTTTTRFPSRYTLCNMLDKML